MLCIKCVVQLLLLKMHNAHYHCMQLKYVKLIVILYFGLSSTHIRSQSSLECTSVMSDWLLIDESNSAINNNFSEYIQKL